ncbi:MAG: hypothetical protein ACXQTG_00945 [Methanoculleaceae archaeon]
MASGKYLRIGEIAAITGLAESDVKSILREHGKGIPSRSLGMVRLYSPKAVDVVRRHAGEMAGTDGGRHTSPPPPPPAKEPLPDPGGAAVLEIKYLRDRLARQELTISRLAERLAHQEEKIEALEAELEKHGEAIELHDGKIRVTCEWVDFFDRSMDIIQERIREIHGEMQRSWWDRLRNRG